MPDHCVSVTEKWRRALVIWTMSGRRLTTRNGVLSIGNKLVGPAQLDFLDIMLDRYDLVVLPMPAVAKKAKSESLLYVSEKLAKISLT